MDNDPEETTGADGEVEREAEEPRVGKLLRPHHRADPAQDEANRADQSGDHREPGEPRWLEVFAFWRGNNVAALAHGFSRLTPGGTSAVVAFWLRCNARRYAMIAQRSATVTLGP